MTTRSGRGSIVDEPASVYERTNFFPARPQGSGGLGPISFRSPPMTLADVYEAQLDWVIATLRRLGVPDAEQDDAAHELFLVVHRKLRNYDTSRPLRPWLFGIAFRVARDHLRRGSARLRLVESAVPAEAPNVESQAGARHQLVRIQEALDTLDYERRATFVMYEFDGFTVPQISKVLGCPPNTLYSHLRRARQHVHAHLASPEGRQHEHG